MAVTKASLANYCFLKTVCSAASRAIVKPVYQFGVPNSDPQAVK